MPGPAWPFHRIDLLCYCDLSDFLPEETTLAGVAPLPKATEDAVIQAFPNQLFDGVCHAYDLTIEICTGRNGFGVGKGNAFSHGSRCPERPLASSDFSTIRDVKLHLSRSREQESVDLLLERLDSGAMGVRHFLQHLCGILEESLELVVIDKRIAVLVPGEHGHALIGVLVRTDGLDFLFPARGIRRLGSDEFRVDLGVVAAGSQQLLGHGYTNLQFFHS